MGAIYCDEGIEKVLGAFLENAAEKEIQQDVYVLYGQSPRKIKEGSVIIANGDDPELLMSLAGAEGTVITCGLSGVSTFTFSGMGDEGYVLCLQRAVNTFSGKLLQPQEIPVKVSGEVSDSDKLILILAFGFLAEMNITTIKMEE